MVLPVDSKSCAKCGTLSTRCERFGKEWSLHKFILGPRAFPTSAATERHVNSNANVRVSNRWVAPRPDQITEPGFVKVLYTFLFTDLYFVVRLLK